MEDEEHIERVLALCQVVGLHGVSREVATRSLMAFWKQVRVVTGPAMNRIFGSSRSSVAESGEGNGTGRPD